MARKCVGNHRIIRAIKEGELPGAKIEDGMWIVPSEVVRKWAVKPSRNRL
jgi:hypothetical protein